MLCLLMYAEARFATHRLRVFHRAGAIDAGALEVERNAKGGRCVIMVGGVNAHVINKSNMHTHTTVYTH
eukprot:COSAG02_NODE_45547_length_356_cov_0.785992_1_plen_68_part_10